MCIPTWHTSGGLLETKKIGDYAEENGIAMAMHQAGTPSLSWPMCTVLQPPRISWHWSIILWIFPWWEDLVVMTDGNPMINKGFAHVPESPGLGIELNEDVVKNICIRRDKSFFEPTDEWNEKRSHDRIWS